jgi:molybdopterin-guanine dinucleotide biosynthesis protein A
VAAPPNFPLPALAPLATALLVGGASRRFGRAKALERLDGASFAERAAAALSTVAERADELVLLGDGPVPPALAERPRLADAPEARGPLAGVLAALRAWPERAWLIAACDQPFLSGELCRRIVAARDPRRIAVVVAAGCGRMHPFPGVYEPGARAVLERLAGESGSSLQPLGRREDVAVLALPPELARALRDVDRPADLAGDAAPD